jgi:HD-GYP domain-containing protein (c-di-GMP phosphodiesterase class II)
MTTEHTSAAALQELGRKLLTSFYGALRALKLYPVENAAVQQSLNELHELMSTLLKSEGSVELRVVGDFFFLNETRLRLDFSNFSTFGSFAQALSEHGIGAVDVVSGLAREEWPPFLSLLLRKGGGEDAYETFINRMQGTPVQHIQVRPEKDVHQPELAQEEAMAAAKRTYAQSVKVAKDVLGDMRMGRAVNARKVKRAVQNIVDQVLANEPSIITMTTLKEFDEYTFTHCVNVCIFSVVIGQRLGLEKLQLYDLGLGALLHDIGKMRVGSEIINKPGGLTDAEWAILKEHPTEGLLILFQMAGFNDVPYRQMLMAYEHHMKVDVTGYPTNRRPRNPTLFSRIVAVADGFDAGTSIRSYQYNPWPPDEVLKEMRDNPRRGFDPLLVKALITATGVFPIGTLVILDSYELAVVCGVHKEAERLHLPLVKVISDAMGAPLPSPRTVDLSEKDASGTPLLQILKTTDPQKYGIRVSDYLT